MSTFRQLSFAGGEISPSLYGRVDIVKYATGLRTCRNTIIKKHGGSSNRPGTEYIGATKFTSTKRARLIPFKFSADQTYVIEFGDQYIRFFRDGAQIMSGLSPYEIASPYLEADLPTLNYDQSGDVITLTHPSYETRELSRTAHTSWTLTVVTFEPGISRPSGCSGSGTAGGKTHRYKITAIDRETFEESLGGLNTTSKTITGITKANPAVVTAVAHGFANGDIIHVTGVVGMTEVNDLEFEIANVAADTFQLKGIDSSAYTTYVSGGTARRCSVVLTSIADPTSSAPITLSWTAVATASEYNVYRELNGTYGFIGIASTTSFSDTGYTPDTEDNAPTVRNPFKGANNYPSTSGYYQGRHLFAGSNNNPEVVEGSRSGNFHNFTRRSPLQDDDAIRFNLAGREVNIVKHMVDLGTLIIFTSGAEWRVAGDAQGILRAGEPNPKQQSYNGSSALAPILIGNNALYVQARGSVVRDLGFELEVDGYRGDDLTIFSTHLFDNYILEEWTYSQIPNSIVWIVRNDGALIGITYVKSHQIFAWHKHDFQGGIVESVCSVPEGEEDFLYLIIKRTINGVVQRYVERMSTRLVDDIKDAIFMDSALTYDGRNTNSAHTMTLTGSGWTYTDTLTLTSSAAYFAASDIGNEIHLTGSGGDLIRCEIVGYTSPTVVSVKPNKTVPVSMRSVAISNWAKAVDELSGLGHLEGEEVSVIGDGFVVANPNNAAYTILTVASGSVTLDKPYSVIHAGLPYISDLETLDIDTPQGESIGDKKKIVSDVTIFVEASRGIFAGPKPPSDDETDPLEGLYEYKARNEETYDEPVRLKSEQININLKSEFNTNGRVFIRQVDPLPLSILAVLPAGMFPFRGVS